MRLSDLQSKDIVNVIDGRKLGTIIDVFINESGVIDYLIADSGTFFSKLSSRGEIEVKWSQVKKIGDDVILVNIDSL